MMMTNKLDIRRAELLAENATLADTPEGQARHDEIMAELSRLTYGDEVEA